MTDEELFAKLRVDAEPLRYKVDDATLDRIRMRIQERIAPRPTVATLLASWFRPLAAALTVLAIIAAVTFTRTDDATFVDQRMEVVVAGETYVVGN